ncbi:MAG TPA: class I SAM-dependent methyltransferase [Trueperaceae bacterium]
MRYDPETIRGFFDSYGDREWERFEGRAQDRVSLHIHNHYLARFVKPGMHVLDAGAGPGRFTIELARIGARVTVLDISPQMLEQNRRRVARAGLEGAVVERRRGDIVDLSEFAEDTFDAVVCYGGPVSYVMDRADEALAELVRVARPAAPLLLSVMSTLGATRSLLPAVLDLSHEVGTARIAEVLASGLLLDDLFRNKHVMKMYRWRELEAQLLRFDCQVVAASSTNFLTAGHHVPALELAGDEETLEALLDWELDCCREEGALDGGSHILAVARIPEKPR